MSDLSEYKNLINFLHVSLLLSASIFSQYLKYVCNVYMEGAHNINVPRGPRIISAALTVAVMFQCRKTYFDCVCFRLDTMMMSNHSMHYYNMTGSHNMTIGHNMTGGHNTTGGHGMHGGHGGHNMTGGHGCHNMSGGHGTHGGGGGHGTHGGVGGHEGMQVCRIVHAQKMNCLLFSICNISRQKLFSA